MNFMDVVFAVAISVVLRVVIDDSFTYLFWCFISGCLYGFLKAVLDK